MGTRLVINKFIDGDWNVICDTCGRKRKRSQCTLSLIPDMPNVLVCTDTCLDIQNPQYFVRGVPDIQTVPDSRSDSDGNVVGYIGVAPYTGPITAADLITNGVTSDQ